MTDATSLKSNLGRYGVWARAPVTRSRPSKSNRSRPSRCPSIPFHLGGALWLISWRVFQGVGGAMLMASSSAVLTDAFPA